MVLNEKQKCFCREYIKDLNATQAAIRAGYSEKTAMSQGCRLLMNVKIVDELNRLKAQRQERLEVDADYVLKRLCDIDAMDVADILTDTGDIKPISDWPKVWRTTISGLDVATLMEGDTAAVLRKIKWPDKVKNLELMGKHIAVQAFNERSTVETVDRTELIAAARKRAQEAKATTH